MPDQHIIEGTVVDSSTGDGVAGIDVEAWDRDFLFDDLVGRARSSTGGAFRIEFNETHFRELFFDHRPDLYFVAFCDGERVLDTRDDVLWNADSPTHVELRAKVPDSKRPTAPDPCCVRDVYLKIEPLLAYSPVFPNNDAHHGYRQDCFRTEGHADGTIGDAEVELRRLDALVYREYADSTFSVPKETPLVATDLTEPPAYTRVPGVVIYTRPGQRLRVHVMNCDDTPHSLHMHGLAYGVDSDGAWPFGTSEPIAGARSDEICPGETWTYVYDVTDDAIGAWPFHDHFRRVQENTNRGLFGGIVVRDPSAPRPDLEVPFFMHRLEGERGASVFDSGTMNPGDSFEYTFPAVGTFSYYCRFHPMLGNVHVVAGEAPAATVNITDDPPQFDADDVTIAPGGVVTWTHAGNQPHTVTEREGAGALSSFCINGRVFAGNTPRIAARSGDRIRWYVFNLDFGMDWHNFHTHGQRWRVGDENQDTRSLGPAESFAVDTVAPDVVLPQCRDRDDKGRAQKVEVCAEFPVHCHVEPHMMQGMAATLQVRQELRLTKRQRDNLGFELPGSCDDHGCPDIELDRCRTAGGGSWEALPDSPVFVVHAALVNSSKVLLFSGRAEQYHLEADYPLESRLFDPSTNAFTSQVIGENLFCSGHAFLPDGRLLVGGGDRPTSATPRIDSTHVFDPTTDTWSKLADMNQSRWYPSLVSLADGRVLAASGQGAGTSLEIFDTVAQTWQTVAGADRSFPGLYPSLHALPNGDVFHSRTSWNPEPGSGAARLRFTGLLSGSWTSLAPMEFPDRQEGASVMVVDATVSPPATTIYVIGGGFSGINNPQSCEAIDVTVLTPTPSWYRISDMNYPRTNVNAVLLPNGTIMAIGGQRNGKWAADPNPVLEAEIYDPATDTWSVTPPMAAPRQYHSVAVLLPDGRVISAGGVDPTLGGTPDRDLRSMEIYSPAYLTAGSSPTITTSPASISHASTFTLETPEAAEVADVVLLKPLAVTHHTEPNQRLVRLAFSVTGTTELTVTAPTDGNVAPPGDWMLFIVNSARTPSHANFANLS